MFHYFTFYLCQCFTILPSIFCQCFTILPSIFVSVSLFYSISTAAYGDLGRVEHRCPEDALSVADDRYFRVLNDTCYLLMTYEFETYNVAQSKCRENGGELAMPKTEEVNDFLVRATLEIKSSHGFWIGMHDQSHKGSWVFEDGSDVPSCINLDWFVGARLIGNEDCAGLDPKGTVYEEYRCSDRGYLSPPGARLPYICEYPAKGGN